MEPKQLSKQQTSSVNEIRSREKDLVDYYRARACDDEDLACLYEAWAWARELEANAREFKAKASEIRERRGLILFLQCTRDCRIKKLKKIEKNESDPNFCVLCRVLDYLESCALEEIQLAMDQNWIPRTVTVTNAKGFIPQTVTATNTEETDLEFD